jgi:transcriptional regulator with XRE-family HTH domain
MAAAPATADLAEFLRNRRARLTPEQAGLVAGDRRRVSGLRREELSLLAGVSSDYYVRLEQGRDLRPSDAVLDALAGALQLDDDEHRHLYALARPPQTTRRSAPRPRRQRVAQVPVTTARLLDALDGVPALVLSRHLDVLAWNPVAAALFGDFGALPAAERNMVRHVFLADAARELFIDWAVVAAETVAYLRAAVGADPGDPHAIQLVGELSIHSEEFRRTWARHDVREKSRGTKRFCHPLVGELTLDWEALAVPGGHQVLTTFSAAADSPDADRLQLLAAGVSVGLPSEGSRTVDPERASNPVSDRR